MTVPFLVTNFIWNDLQSSLVLGGKADFLVTGDKDLLVLKESKALGKLKIVTAKAFVEFLHIWHSSSFAATILLNAQCCRSWSIVIAARMGEGHGFRCLLPVTLAKITKVTLPFDRLCFSAYSMHHEYRTGLCSSLSFRSFSHFHIVTHHQYHFLLWQWRISGLYGGERQWGKCN